MNGAFSPGSTSRPFPEAQAALFGQPAQAAALPASWAAGPTHPSFAFAGTCCGEAAGGGVDDAASAMMKIEQSSGEIPRGGGVYWLTHKARKRYRCCAREETTGYYCCEAFVLNGSEGAPWNGTFRFSADVLLPFDETVRRVLLRRARVHVLPGGGSGSPRTPVSKEKTKPRILG